MQLKPPNPSLRRGLMAASCALLGGTAAQAQTAAGEDQPWQVDTALLYYKENAGRLQTNFQPVVSLKKDFGDQRVLDGTFALDTLSGASRTARFHHASRRPSPARPARVSPPEPARRLRCTR